MSNLSPVERETIIVFNDGEPTATVETCNQKWKNKMRAICSKNADCCLTFADAHCERYSVPKRWVKVQTPRQYTEEQRRKMQQTAKDRFHKEVHV